MSRDVWRDLAGPLVLLAMVGALLYAGRPATAAPPLTPASDVVRFHVVANSDTTTDQGLKLEVRNRELALLDTHFATVTSEAQAVAWLGAHLGEIQQVARDVLRQGGADYGVRVVLGKDAFPTKSYGNLVFPAGTYESLTIYLGAARGQNWWCVLFPPLCLVDPTSSVATSEPASASPQPPSVQASSGRDKAARPTVIVRYPLMHALARLVGRVFRW